MREKRPWEWKRKRKEGQGTRHTRRMENMIKEKKKMGPRKQKKENKPGLYDIRDRERETKRTKYKGQVASDKG